MPLARIRQWPAVAAVAAPLALGALAGCEGERGSLSGGSDRPATFVGAVVADEPHAVLAAQEVLAERGSAADAAVALAFALAVTYPSAAGLGGGGQCVVFVPEGSGGGIVQSLDFMPGPAATPADGRWAGAVPGTVRGMDALQARFGRLRWPRTLVAAERLARFGHPVSRSLARNLAASAPVLFRDAGVQALFTGSEGQSIAEGETLVQPDLAALLSRLRLAGGADFYSGRSARLLVDATAQAGGALGAEALRHYQARWAGTLSLPFGNEELHTVPGGGGAVAAAIWGLASADDRYADAAGAARVRLLAEALRLGFARPPATASEALDPDLLADEMSAAAAETPPTAGGDGGAGLDGAPTTSFVVVDRYGMAVACGLTMNGAFGTGRLAPGTGVVLAAAPDPERAPPLAPVVLVNRNSRQLLLAASASGEGAAEVATLDLVLRDRELSLEAAPGGGAVAPGALARVLLELLDGERPLAEALAAPRLHVGGTANRVAVEPALDGDDRAALAARGLRVVEAPAIGRVNAVHCPDGLPREPESCTFASDRRGFGIGAGGTL